MLEEGLARVAAGQHDRNRVRTFESEELRKDGSTFWAEVSVSFLWADDGQPAGIIGITRDITERRKTQELLNRRVAFDAVIARVLAGFASCTAEDMDSRICACLEEMARFVGVDSAVVALFSPDQTTWSMAYSWAEPEVPDVAPRYQQVPMGPSNWAAKKLLAGEAVVINRRGDIPPEADVERKSFEQDGLKSRLALPLRGRGGRVIGAIGFRSYSREVKWISEDFHQLRVVGEAIANLLERKDAEAALNESERRFRTLSDAALEGIMIHDQGVIVDANRAFAQLFGYERPEELIGKNGITTLLTRDAQARIRQRMERQETGPTEVTGIRRDGTTFVMETESQPMAYRGRDVRLVSCRDISDRKSAAEALKVNEERLRAIVEGTPYLFFYTQDAQANTTYVSPTVEFITGYKPEVWLRAKDWFVTDAPINQAARQRTRAHLRGEPVAGPFQVEVRHATGHPILLEIYENPVRREGQVVGLQGVAHDITERKRAEQIIQRLSQLGRQLGAVTDAAELARAVADVADELLGWDACFLKLRSADLKRAWYLLNADIVDGKRQAVERAVSDEITPAEQRVMDAGQQLVLREKPEREDGFVAFGDRARPSMSLLYVPLRHQGRYLGLFSIQSYKPRAYTPASLDLLQTLADHVAGALERIRAEAALAESERRFRDLFERSPDAVFVEDACGTILDANPAACRLHGLSREHLVGQNVLDTVPPEARERVASEYPKWLTGELTQTEGVSRTADGSAVPVEIRGTLIQYAHQPALLLHVRDITERKQAEARIRQQAALLEASHDAILVWDVAGGVQYMNPAAEELTGKKIAEAKSQELGAVLRTRSDLELRAAMQEVTARGDWSGELELLVGGNQARTVASRWTVLTDTHGKPASVLITCNDVTERKQLEAQYLRAQRLESVGTLASGVAHDLNNILSPIIMGVEMLNTTTADADTQSILSMMKESARRGADTVKQLLTFARGAESRRGPVQPRHLLKEIARLLQQTFPKNLQIYTDYAERPATVLADPSQLHQVLMNLCVNARDAMPEGGVLFLTLANQTLDESGANIHPRARPIPYVVFKVSDSGTGIPPEILDRIFDPFFTTKPQGKGTGLGLATVLGIIESHGGFVLVDSKPGQGTTFQVFLPASTPGDTDSIKADSAAIPEGHGELVLVVDDEPAILRMAEGVLRRGGYQALTATSASEALNLYEKHHDQIRAVLTDIMMPFGDGRQLITMLFEGNPALPILAMSGHATSDFQRETLKRGARAFVSKPFTAEQLLAILADVLKSATR